MASDRKRPFNETQRMGAMPTRPSSPPPRPVSVSASRPPPPSRDARDLHEEVDEAAAISLIPPLSVPPESIRSDDVEFHVIRDHHVTSGPRRTWRAIEVWTRHHVYGIDSQMTCFEIIDRATGKPEGDHAMLGARLGGGRRREKDFVRYSYPLPLPGMAAMFTQGRKHGYTSAVDRVVVRVRVLQARPDDALPSWDEIASRWEPSQK
jgi:hypothetical protein